MSKWEDVYLEMLTLDPGFELVTPIELLPGEQAEDAALRYWLDEGILVEVAPDEFEVNFDRAHAVDINIAKFLEAMQQAELSEMLEYLEQDGYIYTSVDNEGNLVYGLTADGKIYFESLHTEDN